MRDLIPICHFQEATIPTYLLAWIPESLLDGRADWDKFVRVEKVTADHDEDIGMLHLGIYPPIDTHSALKTGYSSNRPHRMGSHMPSLFR